MRQHTWDPKRYERALLFAAKAHQHQQYGDLPYLVHPVMVAGEILATIAVEGMERPNLAMQCALLHDTIEDCGVSPQDLERDIGSMVARCVQALTLQAGIPRARAMQASLQNITAQPAEVWMVKIADRIVNLRPPPARWDLKRRRRYYKNFLADVEI